MAHPPIDHSKESIRLFKSDFLEFFTHISPVTITIIWVPVAVISLVYAILNRAAFTSPWLIPLGVLAGLFFWTFAEYMLHRFVFHFPARTEQMQRITFLFHGIHHAQPQDKTRLVMPPVVSTPLALIFYGLLWLILGILAGVPQGIAPLFSGMIFGYLVYDLMHYATHHVVMKASFLRFLKHYHMFHHTKTPDMRFGVSSPLWDLVFRTYVATQ